MENEPEEWYQQVVTGSDVRCSYVVAEEYKRDENVVEMTAVGWQEDHRQFSLHPTTHKQPTSI